MSTMTSPATICLPAHILDANISPRAREVLMLLASQTTQENPTVWVYHAAIAERLRCSPVTVKRAIQKLVEAKLIIETGDLHERRYKFYRVKWSLNERATSKAKDWMPARAGMTKKAPTATPKPPKPTQPIAPPHPGVDYTAMLKDDGMAYWVEVARQTHAENLKRYRMEQLILQQQGYDPQDPNPFFPNS